LARVKSATTGTESTAIAATTTAPSRVVGTEFAIRVKPVTTGIVQTATAVRMTVRQPLHRPAEAGVAAAGVVAAAVEAAGAAGWWWLLPCLHDGSGMRRFLHQRELYLPSTPRLRLQRVTRREVRDSETFDQEADRGANVLEALRSSLPGVQGAPRLGLANKPASRCLQPGLQPDDSWTRGAGLPGCSWFCRQFSLHRDCRGARSSLNAPASQRVMCVRCRRVAGDQNRASVS